MFGNITRAVALAVTVFCSTAKADDGQWISLFNGRNLDGWAVKCRPEDRDKTGYWKVVNGTITAETSPGSKHHYIWLLTEKEYGDFALRLKVQTYSKTTGNSGTQVRSRYDDAAVTSTALRSISILRAHGGVDSSTTKQGRPRSGCGPT